VREREKYRDRQRETDKRKHYCTHVPGRKCQLNQIYLKTAADKEEVLDQEID